jgi:hypothetical protein
MIKKNKHHIWYANSMKLNNEGWDCQKKKIKNITQNKRNWNHKNQYQIKKKELKSND